MARSDTCGNASKRAAWGGSFPVVAGLGVIAAGTAVVFWPRSLLDVWLWGWMAGLAAFVLGLHPALQDGPRWSAGQVAALSGIVVVAVTLRGWASGTIPARIDVDELVPGIEALALARHPTAEIFSSVGWFAMPRLTFAFPAGVMALVSGAPFEALRLSSAIMGVGGVVCTALLGRRVAGVQPAMLGSLFMAASFWHLHDSRTGFPFVQTSFCTALVLYLLVRARQDRSRRALAVAGLCLGLSLQCYFPVRILLVLFPVWWLCAARWERLAASATDVVIVGLGVLLTLGPLLRSVPWQVLVERSRFVLAVHSPTTFLHHCITALSMFTTAAELSDGRRAAGGLLDPVTLGAVIVGVAIACRRSRYTLALVLSVMLTFLCGVVAGDNPRAAYRLGPAMPPLFLLAGIGAHRIWTLRPASLLLAVVFGRYAVRPLERDSRATAVDADAPGVGRRPQGRTVWRSLLLGAAGLIVAVNCARFFFEPSSSDGQTDVRSAAWRFIARHCDGRAFYVLAEQTPLGSDELLELFCHAAFQRIERSAVPDGLGIPDGAAATVLIAESDPGAIAALQRRYPRAVRAELRRSDGQLLLTALHISPSDPGAAAEVARANTIGR